MWFCDKHNFQYAASIIVEKASKLVNHKDNASKDDGDDWNVVCFIETLSYPSYFIQKLMGSEFSRSLTSFIPDLWEERGFPLWVWGFGLIELVHLDYTSCSWNLSSQMSWNKRSCRFVFFLFLQYSRILQRIEAYRPLMMISLTSFFSYNSLHRGFLVLFIQHTETTSCLTIVQSVWWQNLSPLWPHQSRNSSAGC